jgi:peptidoglycan/LPS O-acetylase OafA/YrhL
MVYVISFRQSRFSRFLSTDTMRQFGKISYCLYIIHWGVLWMIFRFVLHLRVGELLWVDFAVTPVALVISIGIAMLSWKFVESPLLHWGPNYVAESCGSCAFGWVETNRLTSW